MGGMRYETWGVDYFNANIPGIGDNIRLDVGKGLGEQGQGEERMGQGQGNHYLIGCGSKSALPFSLLWLLYQHTWLTDAVGKLPP
jgi:hypothetical protein